MKYIHASIVLSYRSMFLQVYIFKFIRVVFLPFGANFSCLFFFLFLFHQAWEVESGSHGVQQQPVLQGQPLPLQVEYTTRQYEWWQGGTLQKKTKKRERKKTKQLEVERAVPRRCGLLAFCAVTSACCYPEDSSDASQARGHRGQNEGDLITWCIITLYEL